MTYQQFEDLPVWREAILLAEEIYRVTQQPNLKTPASFRNQIERAALSVSNNIAEGSESTSTNEFRNFLLVVPHLNAQACC